MGDESSSSPQKPHAGSYRLSLSKYVPNSSVLITAFQSPAWPFCFPHGASSLLVLDCSHPSYALHHPGLTLSPDTILKDTFSSYQKLCFPLLLEYWCQEVASSKGWLQPRGNGCGSLCTPPVPTPSQPSTRATQLPWPLHQLLPTPPTHSPPCSWECARSIYDRY